MDICREERLGLSRFYSHDFGIGWSRLEVWYVVGGRTGKPDSKLYLSTRHIMRNVGNTGGIYDNYVDRA
jgi:hypothetical protein